LRPTLGLRIITTAVRERKKVFIIVATLVLLLDILVPPIILSVVRKPADFLWVNPYLSRLPEYLLSDESLSRKAGFIMGMAILVFSASHPFGTEWGFFVTTADILRFSLMGLILGAYFSVWSYARSLLGGGMRSKEAGGGVGGMLLSGIGLSTGPCSVVGCGAPVIPAIALAFTGLSTGSLLTLGQASQMLTVALLAVMALATLLLGRSLARCEARPKPTILEAIGSR